jgi:hypothetical protein
MKQWIPFREGEYLMESAFLVNGRNAAIVVENATIDIHQDHRGLRRLKGSGRIRPFHLVEMLEDDDRVDLVLHLGEDFCFRLERPDLSAGKVFAEGVKSMMQFTPTAPWIPLTPEAFSTLKSTVTFLDATDSDS